MKSVLGNSAYIRLLTRHNEIFKASLAEFPASSIIKHTGDGYFAYFASAPDAVRFALLFQSRMGRELWQPRPLSARVGIHLGEVAQLDMAGQSDLVGLSAGIAADFLAGNGAAGEGRGGGREQVGEDGVGVVGVGYGFRGSRESGKRGSFQCPKGVPLGPFQVPLGPIGSGGVRIGPKLIVDG